MSVTQGVKGISDTDSYGVTYLNRPLARRGPDVLQAARLTSAIPAQSEAPSTDLDSTCNGASSSQEVQAPMTDTQSTHDVNPVEILYRLRERDAELLYVGITRDWPTRMTQHQRDKPWWSDVSNVEIVKLYGTRQQAEAIEKAVIKTEAPIYNVQHNVTMVERPKRNEMREKRNGTPGAITRQERQAIIEQYSGYGSEWHFFSTRGYDSGWVVEHPDFGEGVVLHCDDDLIHGDVRVNFFDDHLPYRCLSIHWAPLKSVAK